MKVYLVQHSAGEYDDYRTWIDCVCSTSEKAVAKIQEWEDSRKIKHLFNDSEYSKIKKHWAGYDYKESLFDLAVNDAGFNCTLEEYEKFENLLYNDEHKPTIVEMGVL